ncbi:MAG: SurA N-terminal domain-containing protein [Rhodocyclaceae bacterium]|nr:SurA N-terminal domain-containing protein [Rhodocyclaceae bacterium]
MFDLVRNNKRIVQIILALITIPFALWGIDSYIRYASDADAVATVGKHKIAMPEFQQALREQQERLRAQLGEIDAALLASPEVKRATLENLITQRLLLQFAFDAKSFVGDAQLASFITSQPSLQENGKFSRPRYEALVAAQGLTVEGFEARLRQDLMRQQPLAAVANGYAGKLSADRWVAAQLEARQVREAFFPLERYAGSPPDEEAIRRYYESRRTEFEQPEAVRVEYLVLDESRFLQSIEISEEQIRQWYESHLSRFKKAEERRASHILLRLSPQASEREIEAVRQKAEALRQQALAKPSEFSRLAKEHSQDPGSAAKGGDLGFFTRGMMVRPFEEAVFALKEGEISPVIRSDFGFHVIQLTGVRPERIRPLEEVRSEVAQEIRREIAARRFAEAAEGFANLVYEQADSLKPAAEKYGLTLETSAWIVKGGAAEGVLAHPKLQAAIFSQEAIEKKRNTEAIDLGNRRLVAARVIEHRPAEAKPLSAVRDAIVRTLLRESQRAAATAAGEEALRKLKNGEKVELSWGPAQSVRWLLSPHLEAQAKRAIFSQPADKLPAYVGIAGQEGYRLYRIEQVAPYDVQDSSLATAAEALRQRYGQTVAQIELGGWVAGLRARYGVTVFPTALEKAP